MKNKKSVILLLSVIVIAIIGLIGLYTINWIILASFSASYFPIAQSTAWLFIMSSTSYLLFLADKNSTQYKLISRLLIWVILLVSTIIVVDYIFNFNFDLESLIYNNTMLFGDKNLIKISPIAAGLFILIGISFLNLYKINKKPNKNAFGFFSLLVFLISFIFLIGYIENITHLHQNFILSFALPTALCFILLSLVQLSLIKFQYWPFYYLKGSSVKNKLSRTFVLIFIFFFLTHEIIVNHFILNKSPYSAVLLVFMILLYYFFTLKISKRIGSEVLKSETRFKTMFDEAPIGIALINSLTGRFLEVNPYFTKITGRNKEEIERMDWMSITHPDDIQKDLEGMVKLNAGTIARFNMKKRYFLPNGSIIWINMTLTLFPYEDKTKPHHLSMIEDITEQKLAEEKIIEERNKTKQYLDIAAVILVSIDSSGIVQLINLKGCEILGYTEEEIIGTNWFDNYIPEHQRKEIKLVSKKVFNGEIESVKNYENTILTKSGEERLIAWKNVIIKDSEGKLTGVLSSGEDITERKIVENELKSYRENLENLVKERTYELEDKNLNLEQLNNVFVGRELRMAELKEEIDKLKKNNVS